VQPIHTILRAGGQAAVVLPDPDILANEIIENIEASLKNLREVLGIVNGKNSSE
jgi:hypothetical protein